MVDERSHENGNLTDCDKPSSQTAQTPSDCSADSTSQGRGSEKAQGSTMDDPAWTLARDTDQFVTPQTFGEYVILSEIGAGGMGRVFKARHKRMDRVVALKQLPVAAKESSDAVRRFQREVRALAKLAHPNIVTAHDAGEQHGLLYLVMRYIDGRNLKSIVDQDGPFAVPRAVDCITQTAKGLDFAHGLGIVHRDIKPANLVLDKTGTVKILDLGVVLFEEAFDSEDDSTPEKLTFEGQQLGTANYMPPEQAEDAHQADQRSDIYALGCTLFYLLTGDPPYRNESPAAVMMAHAAEPIPSIRQKRNEVHEELESAFKRMMAKNPDDRFQNMSDVISALDAAGIAQN